MVKVLRPIVLLVVLGSCFSLQGCMFAAGAAAGGAAGYEAHKHGYRVQSPVKKDEAGGYKGQSPVTNDKTDSDNSSNGGT